jgi:hypothetical protein
VLVVELDDLVTFGAQAGAKVEAPQVHHRYAVEAELAQIVVDRAAQLGGPLRGRQGYRAAARPSGVSGRWWRGRRRPC